MSSSSMVMRIDVVYAEPNRVIHRTYRVEAPITVAEVLRTASADAAFAGIEISHAGVGVFGRLADPQQLLRDQDRIEIYRPLSSDPKLARRARVRQARKKPGSPRKRS